MPTDVEDKVGSPVCTQGGTKPPTSRPGRLSVRILLKDLDKALKAKSSHSVAQAAHALAELALRTGRIEFFRVALTLETMGTYDELDGAPAMRARLDQVIAR